MSADNYGLVRRHPNGRYVLLHGSASVDEEPEVDQERAYQYFDRWEDCLFDAERGYFEYGVSVHPECREPAAPSPGPLNKESTCDE